MKFIRNFFITVCSLLVIIIGITVLFDPFYHYHKPLPGLKAVLTEKAYQVPGTISNFDYDSILLGTSIAENTNLNWLNDSFDCTTVKAIRASGSNADLLAYLDMAYQNHEIKNVFYSLELFSMTCDTVPSFKGQDFYFLMNQNPFDDVEYLINKDILLKKIPYNIYQSVTSYDEGEAYSWYYDKNFSKEAVIAGYYPQDFITTQDLSGITDIMRQNVDLLKSSIQLHPDTTFYIYFSPSSILWWDNQYRTGLMEQDITLMQTIASELSTHDNVKIFCFQNDTETITDLNHYMDTIHFNIDINKLLIERMSRGEYAFSTDNMEQVSKQLREMVVQFSTKDILNDYPKAVVQ